MFRCTETEQFQIISTHLQGLIERLNQGPVIGDGGFISELERRGYCEAGPWTPEAVIENPDVSKNLFHYFRFSI